MMFRLEDGDGFFGGVLHKFDSKGGCIAVLRQSLKGIEGIGTLMPRRFTARFSRRRPESQCFSRSNLK